VLANPKLTVIPTAVLATSEKATAKLKEIQSFERANTATLQPRLTFASATSTATPMSEAIRDQALANVKDDLIKNRIIEKDGKVSKEVAAEFNFEFQTSIPTPGIVVKGCLDDCNTCEEAQQQMISLEIEHQKLQNKLLARQIELLEKSQEYRCCPADELEIIDEDA
jgi:predicted transcriptional regulator